VTQRRAPVVGLTISSGSLSGLADRLRAIGVTVRERPLLTFAAPESWAPLDTALQRLPSYQAVAVTSPRAALAMAQRAEALRVTAPKDLAVWAAGPATAAPLEDRFGPVHVPSSLVTIDAGAGSTLAGAMLASAVRAPVLFPCGDARRDELPAILRASGVAVEEVQVYRSVLADPQSAREAVADTDAVLVASPKVATLLASVTRQGDRPALVAIGPTTATAARRAGWAPDGVARAPAVDAVLERIRDVLGLP
jgi:uroporphyrinogen-III synthase